MKDFSINNFHKKYYIVSYDVDKEKSQIRVTYANGFVDTKDYSINEEMSILHIMRNQVDDCYNNYEKALEDKEEDINKLKEKKNVLIIIALIMLLFSFTSNIIIIKLLTIIVLSKEITESIVLIKNLIFENKYIKDYEKVLYFIDNIDAYNNNNLNDNIVLDGLSKSATKYIKSANLDEEIPVINLNSIDYFDIEDLIAINDNGNKSKTLSLKPVNKDK